MRRSTCLRSTNGAKATKSSTVRLPKLRSSNKHSGSKHIDYSGNSDGGDGDDKCNQKYISLVCNIRNNQPATICCWVLWKLLFFSSLLFFLFPFGSSISETYEKQLFGFFFIFKTKPKKKIDLLLIRFGDGRAQRLLAQIFLLSLNQFQQRAQ